MQNDTFDLILEALREVEAELGLNSTPGQPILSGLASAFARSQSIPDENLLLGQGDDGQRVLLNLNEPAAGPLLVLADQGCGKTALLRKLAQAAGKQNIQFAILTNSSVEWHGLESVPFSLGVYPLYQPAAVNLLYDLACRAESGTMDHSILLIFDGLDFALNFDPASQDNLRYLLARGSQAQIWPLVSLNASRAVRLPDWVSFFRMRVYGRIARPEIAEDLTPIPGAELETLLAGDQFCLRKNSRWLRFKLPED